jgi:hypothetical protein
MLRENLRDAGEIVENILSQPLSITGVEKPISLLEASKIYLDNPASPELKKVVETFLQYPEAFQLMQQEMTLLAKDLS